MNIMEILTMYRQASDEVKAFVEQILETSQLPPEHQEQHFEKEKR